MPFDIVSGVAPQLNTGTFMQFQNADSSPMVNDEKEPVGVVLLARNSQAGLAQVRENGNRRLADAQSGTNTATVQRSEAETADVLAAVTVEFRGFDQLDGVEIDPKSREFAKKFWSDDRFRRHRARAEDWIVNEANFTKG